MDEYEKHKWNLQFRFTTAKAVKRTEVFILISQPTQEKSNAEFSQTKKIALYNIQYIQVNEDV